MRGRFIKMHGLGNDFVVIDGRDGAPSITPALARAIADRRRGIGCDQLILIEPAVDADIAMRIFNADGSESGACGNATRCVAALAGRALRIATAGGLLYAEPAGDAVRVDMGAPRFDWQEVPLAYALDTATLPVAWDMLSGPTALNVGNPHLVFFVDDAAAVPLDRLGPEIERDPLFPERINVNVASRRADGGIDLRVWERGAGLTEACGTGACATAVSAIRRGLATSPVTVHLPGGALTIGWSPGGSIEMTGPATRVFEGEADWSRFA